MIKKKDLGFITVLVIFLVAGALSWSLYFKVYTQEDTVDIKKFPMAIGEWIAEDIPLTKKEIEILETDNVFTRRYTNSNGKEVYLFIVYSQNNRKVSHPPELCYTGGGATIVDSGLDTIQSDGGDIKANRFNVEIRNTNQSVFYWFKVGDSFTANYWQQQGLIALKSFLGQPSSSALIRISALYENDEKEAIKLTKSFGELIVPHIKTYLPSQ